MTLKVHPLHAVKLIHTVIWAFFASCIIAIPFFAWGRKFDLAFLFIGIVTVEVLVIIFNSWACPLTAVAARHTTDRRDNFDIYLPEWLARHNKVIFGSLFAGSVIYTVARWLGW